MNTIPFWKTKKKKPSLKKNVKPLGKIMRTKRLALRLFSVHFRTIRSITVSNRKLIYFFMFMFRKPNTGWIPAATTAPTRNECPSPKRKSKLERTTISKHDSRTITAHVSERRSDGLCFILFLNNLLECV